MFREVFSRIVQLSATIASLLKSAFPYPASLTYWPKIVIIGSWVISFLLIRPNQRWSKYLLIISMIVGLVCGFWYWILIDSMTIEVDGKVYIRGELTNLAKERMEKYPTVSEKEMLMESDKQEDWIWKPESRRKNRTILGLLYSLYIFFFGLSLIGALEKYARLNTQAETSDDEGSDETDEPPENE